MSDNEQMNEKVDDVLAEMLERADDMQTHGTTHGVRLAIREFVRRIKTARKREREEVEADALAVGGIVEAARTAEKSSAVGSAAAMREALENAYSLLCEGIATEVDDELKHPFHLELACEKIQNALSAPPRNCDLYDSQPKMSEAYESYRKAAMKKYGDGLVGGVPTIKQKPMTYDEWLLAPATERKGEADGSR